MVHPAKAPRAPPPKPSQCTAVAAARRKARTPTYAGGPLLHPKAPRAASSFPPLLRSAALIRLYAARTPRCRISILEMDSAAETPCPHGAAIALRPGP